MIIKCRNDQSTQHTVPVPSWEASVLGCPRPTLFPILNPLEAKPAVIRVARSPSRAGPVLRQVWDSAAPRTQMDGVPKKAALGSELWDLNGEPHEVTRLGSHLPQAQCSVGDH